MCPTARALTTTALAAVLIAPAISPTAALSFAARAGLTFAVIGDNGTGKPPQYDVGRQMLKTHQATPFELVLMVGDNLYGSQTPRDFVDKFESPYGPLLRMGIPFYAALGNHDDPDNRKYPKFNMVGQRYYTLVRDNVRFIFLDTNLLDEPQLKWFEAALAAAVEPWKIVVLHHPLYSNGDRHGSNVELRVVLEPLMVRYGVAVAFAGHDHTYERLKPQKGITHFVVGSSGQLRKGGLTPAANTAAFYADEQAFLIATIDGDDMTFQAISRTGAVVDSGVVRNRATTEK